MGFQITRKCQQLLCLKEDGLSHLVAEEQNEQKPNGIKPGYSGHNMFGKSPAQKWQSNNYGNFIILILEWLFTHKIK